jgi:hypothetical protein
MGRFRKLLIVKVKDKKYRQDIMRKITRMDINDINRMGFKKVKQTFLGSKK